MQTLYYVANARLPNDKAHGIQIAKTCEAYAKQGIEVTLVIPSRKNEPSDFQEFYGLATPIVVRRIRVPDLYLYGPLGFAVSSLCFMLGYTLYLRRMRSQEAFAYSVDMDTYSFVALVFSGMSYACEMHGAKKYGFWRKLFFKCARGIIAINAEVKRSLVETFRLNSNQVLVEPNGVDISLFSYGGTKVEARQKLGIPQTATVALYVGRMYAWKGLEILSEAACLSSDLLWYVVGAQKSEYQEATRAADAPENLEFKGDKKPQELAPWLAAADALVIVGTKRYEESYRYTAPMKLFEYLAAERPLVVCDTPALRSIAQDIGGITWYKPDDATDLVHSVHASLGSATSMMREEAELHSWDARAKRIRNFLNI